MRKLYYKNRLLISLIKFFENKRLFSPLKLTILSLKDYGYWPKKVIALDAFCQTGLQWTRIFSNEVEYLEMWDIDATAIKYARKSFPKAEVICGDSVNAFKLKGFKRSDYNFILIDSPVPFMYPDGTFEHFGFFNSVFSNLASEAVIIFDVVPYMQKMLDLHPHPKEFAQKWENARALFYGQSDGKIILPSTMEKLYPELAKQNGFKTLLITYNARNSFFGFVTMVVSKI